MENVTGVNAGMLNRIELLPLRCSVRLGRRPRWRRTISDRPVTIIVASTAGGGTDIVSGIVGEQLSKQLGQPFVVDNRPGAGW